jgi:hypothetical protein
MSGGATEPSEAAPLVAAEAGCSESALLRELGGDQYALREVEMGEGEDSGSELSELEDMEEEKEEKETGRPNFIRADPHQRVEQSTQEFFRRRPSAPSNDPEDNIFATPGKATMGGALAHALSAVAPSSPHQMGMALTPEVAKDFNEGVGMEVAPDDWAEEVASQGGDAMEGVTGPDRSPTPPTPTPTPAKWGGATRTPEENRTAPVPVPVTPTKGSKRMAMGTPRPTRRYRPAARPIPVGFAAASALEQILAAIAGVERKMEGKIEALKEVMMEGMTAMVADADSRAAAMMADAEEREKRLAVRLLAFEGLETEMVEKGKWEIEQWKVWAKEMGERKGELRAIKATVDGAVQQLATLAAGSAVGPPAPCTEKPQQNLMLPVVPAAPGVSRKAKGSVHQQRRQTALNEVATRYEKLDTMEGVVATAPALQENPIEEWSEMEGVEREGLYASQHAPPEGEEPAVIQPPARPAARKAKGKGKEATPVAPRSILKRPETAAVERASLERKEPVEGKRKAEEKEVARKRWEDYSKMSEMERWVYDEAVGPIKATTYDGQGSIEEAAAIQQIVHKVGIRAVEERWERRYDEARAPPEPFRQQQWQPPRQVQQQQQQQQRQVSVPVRPVDWAQRAQAAASLPQTKRPQKIARGGKTTKESTGLEPVKRALKWDERMIVFERSVDAPQITPATATSVVANINIALSKVAPPHVRTTVGKISARGRLSTMAREGASAAMLLRFKKEIIEAARKADRGIINVRDNESWVELKILVPYVRYRHPEGLADLREQIEAENEGVVVPPFSMRWVRAKNVIESHYQQGALPAGRASVVFKVPNKAAGQKLLSEIWVAGNRFKALPYVPNRADTLCGRCSHWGHSEFRCPQAEVTCAVCSGSHRTESHKCEVATCGAIGQVCPHTVMRCPNCGGNHPAQDGRCRAKGAAIAIARGARSGAGELAQWRAQPLSPSRQAEGISADSQMLNEGGCSGNPDEMEAAIEMETSGTAPPVAV